MMLLRAVDFLVIGVLPFVLADSTKTFKTCTTKLGTSSRAKVGSTTYGLTITLTATKRVTSTPTITITPSSTLVVQQTVTSTVTATELLTTTATVVIPTSSGFTPINGVAAVTKRAEMRFERRDEIAKRAGAVCSKASLGSNGWVHSPPLYPSSVTCAQLVDIVKTVTVTKTASATTITAPVPVSTNVNTVYATVTTTNVVAAPAQTSYAACAANNQLTDVDWITYRFGGIPIGNIMYTSAPSAYDCCVACQTTTNCAASVYYGDGCELDLASSCSPGTSIADAHVSAGSNGLIISNGPCGSFTPHF